MGIFKNARREIVDEIKKEVMDDIDCMPEHEHVNLGEVNLDSHRELEAMVKRHLGARHVVMCAEMLDGTVLTYIPEEIGDKDLVYLIQTLTDLRNERLVE